MLEEWNTTGETEVDTLKGSSSNFQHSIFHYSNFPAFIVPFFHRSISVH
jgi:hypothetical protein